MGIDHALTEGIWKRSGHHHLRPWITGPPAASNLATIQLPWAKPTSIPFALWWRISTAATVRDTPPSWSRVSRRRATR
jgi:hypothetical protein